MVLVNITRLAFNEAKETCCKMKFSKEMHVFALVSSFAIIELDRGVSSHCVPAELD